MGESPSSWQHGEDMEACPRCGGKNWKEVAIGFRIEGRTCQYLCKCSGCGEEWGIVMPDKLRREAGKPIGKVVA